MDLIPESDYFKAFVEAEKIKFNTFERVVKFFSRIIKLPAPSFIEKKISLPIKMSDLKVTPSEVYSASIAIFIISFIIALPVSLLHKPTSLLALIFPPFIAYNLLFYPIFYSEVIKVRAGNETVSIILHMITYLSLNPVYEKAIEFAAIHSHGPLGRDLKKLVWSVHSGKYPDVKSAISEYSKKWSLWNEEFVNSLLLLQMIEVQATEEQREEVLNTALERIMSATAKQMEEYAFGLKMPAMVLLMLGITLPLMGLVVFPLITIFLADVIDTSFLVVGYLFILPFFLTWFLYRMISKRPATFSTSEKLEEIKPNRYIKIGNFKLPIIPIALVLGILIAFPGIIYFFKLYSYKHYLFASNPINEATAKWEEYCISRYEPKLMLADTFKAMFIIWGIAASVIFATHFRSKGPYEFDQYIRKMEREFIPALFELHSSLRQNVPVESALWKIVEQYKKMKKSDSPISKLFEEAYFKLVKTGTSLRDVFFGKKGLISQIPSPLIKNVMSIISSAFMKGPLIASKIAGNVASYLKRIEEIEEGIKKNLQDIISNLKSQGNFIAPLVAGIVGSSSVIIIQLLEAIAKIIQSIEKMYSFGTHVGTSMYNTLKLIDFQKVMPPTVMQVIAGIYLIEIIIIISYFLTGIRRGFNSVYRDRLISRMLSTAVIFFTLVFFVAVLMFQPIIMKIKV